MRILASSVVLWALVSVGAAPQPTNQSGAGEMQPGLGGTSWRLVQFRGSDGTTLTPDDRSKYTIEFLADGGLVARIDCNRGRGTWKSSGPNQLELGPMALTKAMCPPGSLHDQIVKQWKYVRSYVLKDGHLFLSLMADGGIYEYEPVSGESAMSGRVKGTATYRERMALPPDAVLEATLEDVSKADAPAEVIGRVRIEKPGNPPIPFEIPYDPSRIDPRHRYVVRARILVPEKIHFNTDQQYPVLTGEEGKDVALMLRRASASGPAGGAPGAPGGPPPAPAGGAGASLEKTYWRLIRMGDTPVTSPSSQREPHLILDPESRRVAGSGGCNRLMGSYELNGEQLTFSKMAGTMMACIDGMETEKAFLETLVQARKWKIAGQRLELFDAAGNLVAVFEARPGANTV